MRLFDELFANGWGTDKHPDFKKCMVFDIQEVSDAWYKNPKPRACNFTFDNIAPPFDNFFMEWAPPDSPSVLKAGAQFTVIWHGDPKETDPTKLNLLYPEARWVYRITLFAAYADGSMGRVEFDLEWPVGMDFGLIKDDKGAMLYRYVYPDTNKFYELDANVLDMLVPTVYTILLALDITNHTQTIRIVNTPVSRQRKRQSERMGIELPPTFTHRIITLDGKTRYDVERGGYGLGKPLHMVRAADCDYRERGLFGKYRAIFRRAAHKRGNPDRGVSHHNYKVG